MDTPYPFSGSFGLADTRDHCATSAQQVYERLLLKNNRIAGKLHFDTMAVLALQRNGELDSVKAKELIRTFRPDRDGGISMIDFVRSIDSLYKDLRMLRATVAASSKIDKALESIMNIFFYAVCFCITLAAFGIDPLALFLSFSSVILAFAFMIGSASAKYFEVRPKVEICDKVSIFSVSDNHKLCRVFCSFWYNALTESVIVSTFQTLSRKLIVQERRDGSSMT